MLKKIPLKTILKNYYIFLKELLQDLFDDKLGHYASSLSWSTLFSLLPLMVILISIFTSMPFFSSFYSKIEQFIFSNLMPANSEIIMTYINGFVKSTDKLGYLGAIYVSFAVFMFFKNYDFIVNDIFETSSRSLWGAIKIYFLLLIVVPVFLGISFYFSSLLHYYLNQYSLTTLTQILHVILPFFIVWATFYLAYQFSANIPIDIRASLISSFIASLIWYISKNIFIFYVTYNETYTTIYGNISILLFFFLWTYISWAIFIHGLKFCALLNKDEEI